MSLGERRQRGGKAVSGVDVGAGSAPPPNAPPESKEWQLAKVAAPFVDAAEGLPRADLRANHKRVEALWVNDTLRLCVLADTLA